MASGPKTLDLLARILMARRLDVLPFSFGILAIPINTPRDLWTPVGAARVSVIPAGDGKPASLAVQGGYYIPSLEQTIQAHDLFWPTTWGAAATDDAFVERLSIVEEQLLPRCIPQNVTETEALASALCEMVDRHQANTHFDLAKDYFAGVINEDREGFLGIGFQYALIRHHVFNRRHRFALATREELLQLIRPAGPEATHYLESFFDWFDSNSAGQRLYIIITGLERIGATTANNLGFVCSRPVPATQALRIATEGLERGRSVEIFDMKARKMIGFSELRSASRAS